MAAGRSLGLKQLKTSKLSPTGRTKYGIIPLSSRERFPDAEKDDIQKNHGSHAAV
jgi:hypothetical protein